MLLVVRAQDPLTGGRLGWNYGRCAVTKATSGYGSELLSDQLTERYGSVRFAATDYLRSIYGNGGHFAVLAPLILELDT